MVVGGSLQMGRVLRFQSEDAEIGRDKLVIVELAGTEAISELFRFDLVLMSTDPEIDSKDLLTNPVHIGIKQRVRISATEWGVQTRLVHGIVTSFSQHQQGGESYIYRAVVEPRISRLKLNLQTRTFFDLSVPDIIKEVCEGIGFVEGVDFEFRDLARSYATRKYVVQYRESDYDFLCRIAENDGIFFNFEHGEDPESDKVVFGDSLAAFSPITGETTIPYHPAQSGGGVATRINWYDPEVVETFDYKHVLVPADVKLTEYNCEAPDVPLAAEKSTGSDTGFGTQYSFGDGWPDEGEGKALAEVRAQEYKAWEKTYSGISDVRHFTAGGTFTLDQHYRASFNMEFLLVQVLHTASQSISLGQSSAPVASYHNQFMAMSTEDEFRPRRITPKPKITGTLPAIVTSGGDAQYAEVNADGKYSVTTAWDAVGGDTLGAAMRIRKAEPHAGVDAGFHIPSRPGTEVAMSFRQGDPDCPMIMGTLAKPGNESPVTASNYHQAVWKMESKNEIRMDDLDGSEDVYIHAEKDHTIAVENDKTETIGNDNTETIENDETIHVKNNRDKTVDGGQSETIGSNKTIDVGGDHTETISGNMSLGVGGDRTAEIGGNDTETVSGLQSVTIILARSEKVGLASTETVGLAKSVTVGASYTVKVGAAMAVSVIGSKEEEVGGSKTEAVNEAKQVTIGGNLTESIGEDHSETVTGEFSLIGQKSITVEAKEDVILKSPKASITLKKSGEILIEGKAIQIKGTDIKVEGSGDVIIKGKNVLEN